MLLFTAKLYQSQENKPTLKCVGTRLTGKITIWLYFAELKILA